MNMYERSVKEIINSYKQVFDKFEMLVKDEGKAIKFEKVDENNFKAIVKYEGYEIECKLNAKQVFKQMMDDKDKKLMPGNVIEEMINKQVINYLLVK